MKIFTIFLLLTLPLYAKTHIDMAPGYWEYTPDLKENPMLKMAMESIKTLPKEQREKIMKKMGAQGDFTKTYKCFTEKDMKNWEHKIAGDEAGEDCKIKVNKNSKKVYKLAVRCKETQKNVDVTVKMDSNKKGMTTIESAHAPGPIKVKMKWLKSKCPKGS